MAERTLIERLTDLELKHQEISTLITDPAVIADMKRYVKLNKEYSELGELVKLKNEYQTLLGRIAEAREIVQTEKDPEMLEMAKAELAELEPQVPKMEEDIKLALIPSDPEDSRNAIVEIRGGAGGDEAAIFAGDLYRMYMKYCETKGWSVSISSFNEGTAGGYKEIVFTISGEKVYGTMKYESECTVCRECQ